MLIQKTTSVDSTLTGDHPERVAIGILLTQPDAIQRQQPLLHHTPQVCAHALGACCSVARVSENRAADQRISVSVLNVGVERLSIVATDTKTPHSSMAGGDAECADNYCACKCKSEQNPEYCSQEAMVSLVLDSQTDQLVESNKGAFGRHQQQPSSLYATSKPSQSPACEGSFVFVSRSRLEGRSAVDLSYRRIQSLLPDSPVFHSCNITQLDLSRNALSSLPNEIGRLFGLKVLKVSGNKLETLPPALAYCQSLHTIDASYNKLVDLPTSIRHIQSLAFLDASNNSLSTLPAGLCNLLRLEHLDLSNNQLTALPSRMFLQGGIAAPNKGSLKKLLLEGCPLGSGLLETLEDPTLAIASKFKRGVIAKDAICKCDINSSDCRCNCEASALEGTQSPRRLRSLADTVICKLANDNRPYLSDLPDHLQQRIDGLLECDHCHALYPDGTGVTRWRLLYRGGSVWPVEYRFCSPHWSTERQRVALLFGPRNLESSQPYYKAKREALESIAHRIAKAKLHQSASQRRKKHQQQRCTGGNAVSSARSTNPDSAHRLCVSKPQGATGTACKRSFWRRLRRLASPSSQIKKSQMYSQSHSQTSSLLAISNMTLKLWNTTKNATAASPSRSSPMCNADNYDEHTPRLIWSHFEDDVPDLASF